MQKKISVARFAKIIIALSIIGLLLPWLSRPFADADNAVIWFVDLVNHWQWLIFCVLIITTPIAAWKNRPWLLALVAAPLPWLTASPGVAPVETADTPFTVASANMFFRNANTESLIDWLATEKPDVAVIVELSHAQAARLRKLADYPYQQLEPRHDPFGVAIISRHPLIQPQLVVGADGVPHIEARVMWQQQEVQLFAFHPMAPRTPFDHAIRNSKMRTFAKRAAETKLPTIVAGDFNTTPWSTSFAGLREQGLMRTGGLTPTWPSSGKGVMGIPIDHVLVSPHWAPVKFTVGPDLGSDHFPVIAQLALVAAAASGVAMR